MSLGDVIPELLRAVPEFKPDEADVDDRITCLVLHGLVQFTFGLDPGVNRGLLRRVFSFYESLCGDPDREVQMLARDVAWAIAEQAELPRFAPLIGNRLRRYIRESPAGGALLT